MPDDNGMDFGGGAGGMPPGMDMASMMQGMGGGAGGPGGMDMASLMSSMGGGGADGMPDFSKMGAGEDEGDDDVSALTRTT